MKISAGHDRHLFYSMKPFHVKPLWTPPPYLTISLVGLRLKASGLWANRMPRLIDDDNEQKIPF
jgi:hypothetical protein